MSTTLVAGTELRCTPVEGDRSEIVAVIAGITDDVIVLDLASTSARPPVGTRLQVNAAGGRHEADVVHVDDRWLTITRPAAIDAVDLRRQLRTPTRLGTAWRVHPSHAAMADAYIVDLSIDGARLLTEPNAELQVGRHVDIDLRGHLATATVRHVAVHEHGSLVYFGVQFDSVDPDVHQHLLRTIGRLRGGSHAWEA
jgi:hypothetical protein